MPAADLHIPVLLDETLRFLNPGRGGVFLDATLGLGGHCEAILRSSPGVRLFAIDRDPEALELAGERLKPFGDRLTLIRGSFADIDTFDLPGLDGVLMDIGVSSMQIDSPERGFSFQEDGPLDMRMDPDQTISAATIVNTWQEVKLANMIYEYGEERLSRRIARVIVERRRKHVFETTADLAEVIAECYPAGSRHKRPHPATRTFQALRIEVNQELLSLEQGMAGAMELLNPGGVLVVISFHSLEDRIVKYAFRKAAQSEGSQFKILTKKPLEATDEERARNPRSRSAKLRALEKIQ